MSPRRVSVRKSQKSRDVRQMKGPFWLDAPMRQESGPLLHTLTGARLELAETNTDLLNREWEPKEAWEWTVA